MTYFKLILLYIIVFIILYI